MLERSRGSKSGSQHVLCMSCAWRRGRGFMTGFCLFHSTSSTLTALLSGSSLRKVGQEGGGRSLRLLPSSSSQQLRTGGGHWGRETDRLRNSNPAVTAKNRVVVGSCGVSPAQHNIRGEGEGAGDSVRRHGQRARVACIDARWGELDGTVTQDGKHGTGGGGGGRRGESLGRGLAVGFDVGR